MDNSAYRALIMSDIPYRIVILSVVRAERSAGWTQSKAYPELVEEDPYRANPICAAQSPCVGCTL